ncbi:pollen receptor-like kinase 3 [Musa acuminata AAA Group]|uniref:pollen receptor-like kinase 3 n=1 Tax=Musa acuminata AAA Group TaxID=214697 RepID=UPI0031DE5686
MAAAVLLLLLHHHCHHHLLLLLLLLLLPVYSGSQPAPMSDVDALLLLKGSFTNSARLSSWTQGSSSGPCDPKAPWDGVVCLHGVINGLHLADMGLSGSINVDALSHFTGLRSVSFIDNNFSGPVPALGRLHALKAIYLSRNQFSGPIPGDFFDSMTRLKKLWLNGNAFTGPIPASLAKATALLELHLEDNDFTGSIPALDLPSLTSFNVSNNKLEGPIPDIFTKFNASSFLVNKDLCGEQLGGSPCRKVAHNGSGRVAAMCVMAVLLVCLAMYTIKTRDKSGEREIVTLGKARKEVEKGEASPETGQSSRKGESTHRHRRTGSSMKPGGPGGKTGGSGDDSGGGGGGGGAGDLVMVNEGKGVFGLSDLMKAEAEVMGSGGLGSAYKAVMANGMALVVKRVRDMTRVGKESFDAEMARLGRLTHPNVLPPLAYHYRKDEKLLVYEHIPKGSLLYVLHGDRGLDHASLDWPTRLKIVRGIAQGLAHIHAVLPFIEAPHGNLKSANVLLSLNFEPLLVDYGFLPLVNPAQAATVMQALRSPEVIAGRPISPRSDVYCLGVLILELLTGKFPSQYLTNVKGGTDVVNWATTAIGEGREAEVLDPAIMSGGKSSVPEMKRLVHVGVECTEADPDRRLVLKDAVDRIEEVVAAEAQRATAARSHAAYVRDGAGERSVRRVGSIGERSARRSDDSCSFAIS